MKVWFEKEDSDNTTFIRFKADAYDAVPVCDLRLDTKSDTLSRDCYSVVAALCTSSQASGQLDVEDWTCSIHVAAEISRFFAPVQLDCTNVSQQPVPIVERFMTAYLSFQSSDFKGVLNDKEVKLTFSSGGFGAFFSDQHFYIGSNLPPFVGETTESDFDSLLKHIGAALLLVDDFYIETIVVSKFWSETSLDKKFKKVVSLLNTVGVELIDVSEKK